MGVSPRVLFLCTGNSARSQMAEALLRKLGRGRFEVYSAGLDPKDVNPYTCRVLEEIGIDTSGLWSKPMTLYVNKMYFDYAVTLCSDAEERCPVFRGATVRMHWPFDDPVAAQGDEEMRLARFRQVRDQISARILAWLDETPVAVW
jgi:arsenate reductase (thioredoxin)